MDYSQLKERVKILRRYGYLKFKGQEMYMRRFKREYNGDILNVGHWISMTEIIHMDIEDLPSKLIEEYGKALIALDNEIKKLK